MQRTRGFTLIELMIVVAIIAIIAAIAIPSILRSRISANQTSAVGSLDTILKMNTQFRSNDSDNDGENNYWVESVSGLHGLKSAGGDRIELIPKSLARSDYESPGDSLPGDVSVATFEFGDQAPKSGYWVAMQVGTNASSGSDSDCSCNVCYAGADGGGIARNEHRFSVVAFPERYNNTGTKGYMIDESGTTWRVDAKTSLAQGSQFNGSGHGGSDDPNTQKGIVPVDCLPSDNNLDSNWSTSGN